MGLIRNLKIFNKKTEYVVITVRELGNFMRTERMIPVPIYKEKKLKRNKTIKL